MYYHISSNVIRRQEKSHFFEKLWKLFFKAPGARLRFIKKLFRQSKKEFEQQSAKI